MAINSNGSELRNAPPLRTPSADYRRTAYRVPERPLQGLDAVVNWCIGRYQRRNARLQELRQLAALVESGAKDFADLDNHRLQSRLFEFQDRFRREPSPGTKVLLPALAALREAAFRCLDLRPFPVQLMGALALHRGWLAEMATGEGKTLTASLAAVLFGWTKQPTHIVTVNDYLAQRDADALRPFYTFCGVRVGCVTGALEATARAKEYERDVTYTTSKELLADFLRDRLRLGGLAQPTRRLIRRLLQPRVDGADGLVLRGLHTAIVDEADSVLIDEAVTPLIISATRKNEMFREVGRLAAHIAGELQPEADYRVDVRYREVELTAVGRGKLAERCATLPGIWRSTGRRDEIVRTALVAREFYQRDRQYILADGKVVIVDEFTGRPMPQRTWREGLHQAIEAKEGLDLSDPTETVARMSFQRFFRCFHKLAGMTGTAWEAAAEFWQIYGLPVVRIPTNRPCIRQHWPDRFFAKESDKWAGVVDEIEKINRTGRPLLVGTRSVAASEQLARQIIARGLEVQVLNATRLAEEATIVALAGELGRITIATNMAGRGTDIRLGHGVKELGGLHVIATERHESGRVDRQLFGRAARQGDPGSAQAFVSAEDELVRRHLPPAMKKLLRAAPNASLAKTAFTLAQRRAQKLAWKQRLGVLRSDAWLDEALSFAGE
jgi:preprotein translocase subunit SecA